MHIRVHMHDQTRNKIEEAMNHYPRPTMDPWAAKCIVMAACVLIGMYL